MPETPKTLIYKDEKIGKIDSNTVKSLLPNQPRLE